MTRFLSVFRWGLASPGISTLIALVFLHCDRPPAWETGNPLLPLPRPPLGIETDLGSPLALNYPRRTALPTPERIRLGRWLFHDRRLSVDGTVSCASCHRSQNGYSTTERFVAGAYGRQGPRKALSLVNVAWTIYPHYFRDGRAESLEQQVLMALTSETEMGNTVQGVEHTVRSITGYRSYFDAAFGTGDLTVDHIIHALTDYERTLMSGNATWDRWKKRATSLDSLSTLALGNRLFFGKAGCQRCHHGQNFADSRFHNTGIGWDTRTESFTDQGRYSVTKEDAHRGHFKTPTLRDIAKHSPYMHNGSLATLQDVIAHYNKGGTANPYLSPELKPLNLTATEQGALVVFLEALTGEGANDTGPTVFPQ